MPNDAPARASRLPAAVLTLSAVVFAAFGVAFLAAPGLLAVVDLAPATPSARSDARAIFGGLELGAGATLGLCARRPAWVRPGLVAQALLLGGAALGRVVSLALDGVPRAMTFAFLALELGGAALAVVALRSAPRA